MKIKKTTINWPMAELGEECIYPKFAFQLPLNHVIPDSTLKPEDKIGLMENVQATLLPYTPQDNYNRKLKEEQCEVISFENESMSSYLLPSLGGRLMSIFDKANNHELLFNNPVFQPANLAIRNAWFAGGIEWNGPIVGHTMLTCSDVFVASVHTSQGEMVRIYEFDRQMMTVWQVDMLLSDDKFWSHVKVRNLNEHPVDYWWWTNIALPLTENTRVIAPSTGQVLRQPPDNILRRSSFPDFAGFDATYPARYPSSDEIYFNKPAGVRPWLAALEKDGHGLLYTSSDFHSTRKMFTWGSHDGGHRWMDFLSTPGNGDYIEVQGGHAPSQCNTFVLEGNSTLEWTECLNRIEIPTKELKEEYTVLTELIAEKMEKSVPYEQFAKMEIFFAEHGDTPPNEVLHQGSPWGMLHEQLTGKSISQGLDFSAEVTIKERPWQELLNSGNFKTVDLREDELSWNISSGWVGKLKDSIEQYPATWLHYLHLGVAALEAGDNISAEKYFKESLSLKKSSHAYRNLALLYNLRNKYDAAEKAFFNAWDVSSHNSALAIEICNFLAEHHCVDRLTEFINQLPEHENTHERIRLTMAHMALQQKEFDKLEKLLDCDFATIREGEQTLTKLWYGLIIGRREDDLKRPLTADEVLQIKHTNPIPLHLDFQVA